MFKKRTTPNPKHRFSTSLSTEELKVLAAKVGYAGNGAHKRNPGDFGLAPPMGPRPGKTLCDGAGILRLRQALTLLMEGVRRGLVSEQERNGFPQNVWAVTEDGIPLESQLENNVLGTYHGYPLQEEDAFREKVIEKWGAFHE